MKRNNNAPGGEKKAPKEQRELVLVIYDGIPMQLRRDRHGNINQTVCLDGVIYCLHGNPEIHDDASKLSYRAVVDGAADTNIKKLKIPSVVNCGGIAFPVRSIATAAFSDYRNLEEVVLPDGLEWISCGAFLGCHKLKQVSVQDLSQIEIEPHAFSQCSPSLSISSRDEGCTEYDNSVAVLFQGDDETEDEVLYDDGTPVEDDSDREAYEPWEFIGAPEYGSGGEEYEDSRNKPNNNPWISAGVILFCIGLPAFLIWLGLSGH